MEMIMNATFLIIYKISEYESDYSPDNAIAEKGGTIYS